MMSISADFLGTRLKKVRENLAQKVRSLDVLEVVNFPHPTYPLPQMGEGIKLIFSPPTSARGIKVHFLLSHLWERVG
jgi:hypothetical protein